MADEEKRPIIIKKIKKSGHGHHGGAWKVAYADFVTAMMAFFLLLWLLSSAEEAVLEGIAEYFTPTIGIRDSMGIGFEGGVAKDQEGTEKEARSKPAIVPGQTPQGPLPAIDPKDAVVEAEKDSQMFEKAAQKIKVAFESDPNMRDLSDSVIVEQTPEGLKIEITDSDKKPMFNAGSANLSPFGQKILGRMQKIIEEMPNFISITGHTDASPTSKSGNYTNWELSADRANAARRHLIRSGVDPERPKKVIGKADTELLLPNEPSSPRNRRITIIMLRGSYMSLRPEHVPVTRDLLSIPTPNEKASNKVRKKVKEEKKEVKPIAPVAPENNVPMDALLTPIEEAIKNPEDIGKTPEEKAKEAEAAAPKNDTPEIEEDKTKPPTEFKELSDEEVNEFIE